MRYLPCKGIHTIQRLKGHPVDPDGLLRHLNIDTSVDELPGMLRGEDEAASPCHHFSTVSTGMKQNAMTRPGMPVAPFALSSFRADIRTAHRTRGKKLPRREIRRKNAFLEELIVRRELSDNYCHYTPDYDSFDAFPEWAKKTLNDHRRDTRAYLYSRDELESAATHDPLWNAAQIRNGPDRNNARLHEDVLGKKDTGMDGIP